MARTTRSTTATPAPTTGRQPRRAPAPPPARSKAPVVKTPEPAAKTARRSAAPKPAAVKEQAPPPLPIPKLSKGELREQLDKLEQANAKLRMKGRESNKSAKAAAKRIAELEEQVAQLEQEAARRSPPPKETKPRAARRPQQSRSVDPGDAVPPGVAAEEPAPMDEEATAALENLEHNLKS